MAQIFKGKMMVNGKLIDQECEFISRETHKVGDIACVSGVGFAVVTSINNEESEEQLWQIHQESTR
jgi:hypothetical protein